MGRMAISAAVLVLGFIFDSVPVACFGVGMVIWWIGRRRPLDQFIKNPAEGRLISQHVTRFQAGESPHIYKVPTGINRGTSLMQPV